MGKRGAPGRRTADPDPDAGAVGTQPEPEPTDETEPPGDPEEVARIVALRLLDRRACTRAELEKALAKRGVPDDAGRRVLDRFAEVGLVDDAALADGYAESLHRDRGLAGRAVKLRLRRRGVSDDLIDEAVAPIDRASERATAERLVQRKLRSVASLPPDVQARRLVGLLARKGYAPGLAYEVVRAALADLPGQPDSGSGEFDDGAAAGLA